MIFLLVWGVLIWSLVKYRARRGGVAHQIRGNTPLEIGWTLGAASILVVLAVVTFLYLDDIENPPASGPNGLSAAAASSPRSTSPSRRRAGGPILRIHVNGQQYIWRYDYPGAKQLFSYNEMVVPTDTTVVLEDRGLRRDPLLVDPEVRPEGRRRAGLRERDLVQGAGRKEGIYRGQCAELCGPNHADMRADGPRREARGVPGVGATPSAPRSRRPARSWQAAQGTRRGGDQ